MKLTFEQRAVVGCTDRHVVVEAGAGSGKTTVLIRKLLYEMGLEELDGRTVEAPLPLDSIVAITFTRKAAGEIRERLRQAIMQHALASPDPREREAWMERAFSLDEAYIGTIDAFAARVVRDWGGLAGVDTAFDLIEPGDAHRLQREVSEDALLSSVAGGDAAAAFLVRHFGFNRARSVLVSALSQPDLLGTIAAHRQAGLLDWAQLLGDDFNPTADRALERHAHEIVIFLGTVLDAYQARLAEEGILDYAHVLLRASEVATHPHVQRAFRNTVRLMFVDEHQDTNPVQVDLLFSLAGIDSAGSQKGDPAASGPRIVLVGDPKQGIYAFRGADITMWTESWRRLEAAGGRYLALTRNHRSRPELLSFFDETFTSIMSPEKADARQPWEVAFRALDPARPARPNEPAVELLLPESRGAEATADMLAERIAAMLSSPHDYPVWERHQDGTEHSRPLKPRDIAILSRKLKGVAEVYEQALRERGIGCYVYGGSGLYGRQEIQDMASLLRVIADPTDTFALASSMRSPLMGIDDETLALLAQAVNRPGPDAPPTLYDALTRAVELAPDAPGLKQAVAAAGLIDELRSLRDRIPHDELLEYAVERSGYRAYLAGAPDSPAGLRNIDKLVRIASRTGQEPLYAFVETLSERVDRADPEEEAPLYSPDDDLVVISTIHKAKGLEWPYVALTGIDQGMLHRVSDDMPRLDREMGLALPLSVVAQDEDPHSEALALPSRVWSRYEDLTTRRAYAEAKRLFYVAATRARDRLLLAGPLGGKNKPKRVPAVGHMNRQGVEYWLRYVFPDIAKDDNATVSYGSGAHAIHIARGLDSVRSAGATPPHADHQWPAAVQSLSDSAPTVAYPASLAHRLGGVEHHALIREEFTASEIMQFDRSPHMHRFGYRGSISSPTIEVRKGDALVNRIRPDQRGDILHAFFYEYRPGWSEVEQHQALERILLRELPMAGEAVSANVADLYKHARHFLESDWQKRIESALEVRREVPFYVPLTDDIRLRGTLDVLMREDDGWRILDYKAALLRGLEHRLAEELDRRASEYEIQAGVYALAAASVLGPDAVQEFVFYFTAAGEARTLKVTPDWLEGMRSRILEIVRRIRSGDYGPHPAWDEAVCKNCDHLRLCRPSGAPLELMEPVATSPVAARDLPVLRAG